MWVLNITNWLPFSLAPQVFTKVLSPILDLFCSQGIHFVVYLEDLQIKDQSSLSLLASIQWIVQTLQRLDWILYLWDSPLEHGPDIAYSLIEDLPALGNLLFLRSHAQAHMIASFHAVSYVSDISDYYNLPSWQCGTNRLSPWTCWLVEPVFPSTSWNTVLVLSCEVNWQEYSQTMLQPLKGRQTWSSLR